MGQLEPLKRAGTKSHARLLAAVRAIPVNVGATVRKPCLNTIVDWAQKLVEVIESQAVEQPARAAVLAAIEDGTVVELLHALPLRVGEAIQPSDAEEDEALSRALCAVIGSDSARALAGTSGPGLLLSALHSIIQSGNWRRPEAWKHKSDLAGIAKVA